MSPEQMEAQAAVADYEKQVKSMEEQTQQQYEQAVAEHKQSVEQIGEEGKAQVDHNASFPQSQIKDIGKSLDVAASAVPNPEALEPAISAAEEQSGAVIDDMGNQNDMALKDAEQKANQANDTSVQKAEGIAKANSQSIETMYAQLEARLAELEQKEAERMQQEAAAAGQDEAGQGEGGKDAGGKSNDSPWKGWKQYGEDTKNKTIQAMMDAPQNWVKNTIQSLTNTVLDGVKNVATQYGTDLKKSIVDSIQSAKNKAKKKAREEAQKKAASLVKEASLDKWDMEVRRNEGLTDVGLKYLQEYSDTPLQAVKNANDAFHGKVTINGKKYGIVECQYEFTQDCDPATGKPTGRVKGGRITFTMPATSDDDHFFYQWMFDKTKTYSGTFSFVVWARQNNRVYKNFTFLNAYCVGLRDYFNDSDSKLMYTTITIVADSIFMGNDGASINVATFDNEWAGKKVRDGYGR